MKLKLSTSRLSKIWAIWIETNRTQGDHVKSGSAEAGWPPRAVLVNWLAILINLNKLIRSQRWYSLLFNNWIHITSPGRLLFSHPTIIPSVLRYRDGPCSPPRGQGSDLGRLANIVFAFLGFWNRGNRRGQSKIRKGQSVRYYRYLRAIQEQSEDNHYLSKVIWQRIWQVRAIRSLLKQFEGNEKKIIRKKTETSIMKGII